MSLSQRQMRTLLKDIREEHGLDNDEMRAAVVKSGIGNKPVVEFTMFDLCDLHQACREVLAARDPVDPAAIGASFAEGLATIVDRISQAVGGFNGRISDGQQRSA